MLNFTGQTKKRTVRLGDRPGPLGPKGTGDYLQQARLQRIQREEQRQKEKSATFLQRQIKRYLQLKQEGQKVETQWFDQYNHWQNQWDWNVWLSQVLYLSKWIIPRESPDTINKFIDICHDIVIQTNYPTISTQQVLILDSLIELFHRTHVSLDRIVSCIDALLNRYPHIDSAKYPELITSFSACLSKGTISNFNLIRDISLKVSVSRPVSGIFRLLSRPNLFEEITTGDESSEYLSTFKQIWDHSFISELSTLNNSAFISLADNYLTLHKSVEFDEFDFKVLGTILEHFTSGIDIENESSQDVKSIEHVVATLYSTTFIKCAISFLSDERESLRTSALHIISQLVSFHPPSKSKLCMLITITPNAFTNLFSAIKSHNIFKGFLSHTLRSQDYVRLDQINEIYESLNKVDIRVFWDLISTFEEVYSYWLIISNDLESFSKDRLSLEEVSNFLIFLKSLCLTLIFLGGKGEDIINDFTRLKTISLSLLNQLYSKNLRLKFLPAAFWKLNEIRFDINALLPAVAEDEEKRVRDLDLIQEDDNGDISMFDSSPPSRRRSNFSEKIGGDVSYKLEILKKVPFFIDFNDRVKIFQFLIELDKQRSIAYNPFSFDDRNKLSANIRRENLVHDAYNSFHTAGSGLKNQLSVAFYNQYGQEAGIDGGGITKEFLTSVVKEAFNPDFELELFKETAADNQIYPNDDIFKKINKQIDVPHQQERLQYLRFLGTIMGKCLYENILMEISFAPFFLNKWCNQNMKNSIDDLNYLDHELFINLMKLIKMTDEELNELDLNFTINESIDKKSYSFDILPPNGENTVVNSGNKLNYIHQISNFKLNYSLHVQTRHFLDGLFQIVSSSWLSMFDCFELQMLISGAQNDINIQDWKENVVYGAYFDDDLTIKYFWEVVAEMKPEERFKLVKFVTSVSRAPLLGFQALSPKFGIRNSGSDRDRFPTASTCINLLKLPDYRDKELIRHKLLYAINTEAGFDLS